MTWLLIYTQTLKESWISGILESALKTRTEESKGSQEMGFTSHIFQFLFIFFLSTVVICFILRKLMFGYPYAIRADF